MIATLLVNAHMYAMADVVTENTYFQNKARVISDAKGDCADLVEMQIKATPKTVLQAKGEEAVRDRIQWTCAYSNGTVTGAELYKKSRHTAETNVDSMKDIESLDAVQVMRSAALRCAKMLERDWLKANRPSVSREESQDGLIYCMSLEGARDGWSFSAKTNKSNLPKMTEAQESKYFDEKCKREGNCYPQGTFDQSAKFACNKLVTETETKWIKKNTPTAGGIIYKQKLEDLIWVKPTDMKFGSLIAVIETVSDVFVDKQISFQLRHQCHINADLKILGVGRAMVRPSEAPLQLSYRKNGPDPIR